MLKNIFLHECHMLSQYLLTVVINKNITRIFKAFTHCEEGDRRKSRADRKEKLSSTANNDSYDPRRK